MNLRQKAKYYKKKYETRPLPKGEIFRMSMTVPKYVAEEPTPNFEDEICRSLIEYLLANDFFEVERQEIDTMDAYKLIYTLRVIKPEREDDKND